MFELLIRNANLPDGRHGQDIGIENVRIVALGHAPPANAVEIIDATGQLVTSHFVDAHFHMDSTLSYGLPLDVYDPRLLARRVVAASARPGRSDPPARHLPRRSGEVDFRLAC